VQLLAEAMLRPLEWESDWDEFEDWRDLESLGYLHHDPIVTADSMPEGWWASVLLELSDEVEDLDQDGWETIPPAPGPGTRY